MHGRITVSSSAVCQTTLYFNENIERARLSVCMNVKGCQWRQDMSRKDPQKAAVCKCLSRHVTEWQRKSKLQFVYCTLIQLNSDLLSQAVLSLQGLNPRHDLQPHAGITSVCCPRLPPYRWRLGNSARSNQPCRQWNTVPPWHYHCYMTCSTIHRLSLKALSNPLI